MRIRQVPEQPHTYIVENDYGRQLGTVDEFHKKDGSVYYVAIRFTGPGVGMPMFEQKTFSGFTAALQFIETGY